MPNNPEVERRVWRGNGLTFPELCQELPFLKNAEVKAKWDALQVASDDDDEEDYSQEESEEEKAELGQSASDSSMPPNATAQTGQPGPPPTITVIAPEAGQVAHHDAGSSDESHRSDSKHAADSGPLVSPRAGSEQHSSSASTGSEHKGHASTGTGSAPRAARDGTSYENPASARSGGSSKSIGSGSAASGSRKSVTFENTEQAHSRDVGAGVMLSSHEPASGVVHASSSSDASCEPPQAASPSGAAARAALHPAARQNRAAVATRADNDDQALHGLKAKAALQGMSPERQVPPASGAMRPHAYSASSERSMGTEGHVPAAGGAMHPHPSRAGSHGSIGVEGHAAVGGGAMRPHPSSAGMHGSIGAEGHVPAGGGAMRPHPSSAGAHAPPVAGAAAPLSASSEALSKVETAAHYKARAHERSSPTLELESIARAQERLAVLRAQHLPSVEKYWIETTPADVFFSVIIVLQAMLLGIETELTLDSPGDKSQDAARSLLLVLQTIFTLIYCVELGLRVRAKGCDYYFSWRCDYFSMVPLRLLDAGLVFFAVVDVVLALIPVDSPFDLAASLRVFRLLRLFRIACLVRLFPELKLLSRGLPKMVSVVFWTILLLFVFCYCGSLFCVDVLGLSDDPDVRALFGSLPKALLTHVEMALLEAWPSITAPMYRASGLWRYYVAVFICLANLALLNVVTAVICEHVIIAGSGSPPPTAEEQAETVDAFRRKLKRLHERLKIPNTPEGVIKFLRSREVKRLLEGFGISLPLDRKHLLLLLSEACNDGKKDISFEAFFHTLLRLRGSRSDLLSQALQYDVLRYSRIVSRHHAEMERKVQECMHTSFSEPGTRLIKKATSLASTLEQLEAALGSGTFKARGQVMPTSPPKLGAACAELETLSRSLRSTLEHAGNTIDKLELERMSQPAEEYLELSSPLASEHDSPIGSPVLTATPLGPTTLNVAEEFNKRSMMLSTEDLDSVSSELLPEMPFPTPSKDARQLTLSPRGMLPVVSTSARKPLDPNRMLVTTLKESYGNSYLASPLPWLAGRSVHDSLGLYGHSRLPTPRVGSYEFPPESPRDSAYVAFSGAQRAASLPPTHRYITRQHTFPLESPRSMTPPQQYNFMSPRSCYSERGAAHWQPVPPILGGPAAPTSPLPLSPVVVSRYYTSLSPRSGPSEINTSLLHPASPVPVGNPTATSPTLPPLDFTSSISRTERKDRTVLKRFAKGRRPPQDACSTKLLGSRNLEPHSKQQQN